MKSAATAPSPVARSTSVNGCALVATVLAGAGLAAAGSAQAQSTVSNSPIAPASPTTLQAGPLNITFGGFAAGESVWRSRNETADIGSNYGTGIPYAYSSNAHLDEFRESARQSRFGMLIQGPQDGPWSAESYFESDFLSGGVTSNSTESNSYTLRMRHFYGVLRNTDMGWYLLAGQTWSLATLSASGTLAPRAEQIPLTIDAQYAVGFNWTRNAQVRFVKTFGDMASLGLSLESPQASFTGATPAGTTVENNPGVGGGLLPSTNNYSLDFMPDTILKFAISPGWGHYEVYGMERGFRDRYEPTAGSVAGTNDTAMGTSFGAGLILPITSKISFQASGLEGAGIGRYGSAGLTDVAIESNGSPDPIRETDLLLGFQAKPTDRLTLYVYGGEEQAQATAVTKVGTTEYGYGNPAFNNSGCYQLTGSSTTCVANIKQVHQLIAGEWWKAYQGTIGNFQIGLQYSYTDRVAFEGVGGSPSASENMGFVSFRYYPYQR